MRISRRELLLATAGAALARAGEHTMQLHLSCGALGIKASPREAVELAARHGFDVIDADGSYLSRLSDAELGDLRDFMTAKKVGWAMAGLPVDFRRDQAGFDSGMAAFPAYARGLKRAGVDKVTTWITPASSSLPYVANFKLHSARLGAVARVLSDSGIRFGIEYVGPKTAWTSQRYPFIHTLAEMRELISQIALPNVGVVLDSWHWFHAGDSAADVAALRASDVVSVDLNDAPTGVPKDQMVDNKRELPASTGVIDTKPFLTALKHTGYAGPARAEPFNDAVRRMSADEAAAAAVAALRKAFTAAGI